MMTMKDFTPETLYKMQFNDRDLFYKIMLNTRLESLSKWLDYAELALQNNDLKLYAIYIKDAFESRFKTGMDFKKADVDKSILEEFDIRFRVLLAKGLNHA